MTLSKFTICAIVHLHTVGLKGFVTLLGEKGFPPLCTLCFIQCAGEQLQHHVVTDPGRSRIVPGTFVAKEGVLGVELMPLETCPGITQAL